MQPDRTVPDLDDGWTMADDTAPELDGQLPVGPLYSFVTSMMGTVCLGVMAGVPSRAKREEAQSLVPLLTSNTYYKSFNLYAAYSLMYLPW